MMTGVRSRQVMMPTSSTFYTKHNVRLPCNSLDNILPLLMSCLVTGGDRVAEYDMKLMDIDADTLGIPDTDYDARVTMASTEFTRIVRDLSSLGESVRVEVSKEGIRFASDGEAAQGNILLKQTDDARERYENYGKDDDGDDVVEVKEEEVEKPKKPKKEKEVKKEEGAEDEDEEMASGEDEAEFQAKSEDEEDELSDGEKKKRKRPAASSSVRFLLFVSVSVLSSIAQDSKAKKKAKKVDDSGEGGKGGVHIEVTQHVCLTFSLKYLVNFSKSASLSDTVQLMLKNDVPLLVRISFSPRGIPLIPSPC